MLKPCSPAGSAQPRYRSSRVAGSRAGTLSRAARITVALRSSGRTSFREPLKARPIGLRAVDTITASGMTAPLRRGALAPILLVGNRGLHGPVAAVPSGCAPHPGGPVRVGRRPRPVRVGRRPRPVRAGFGGGSLGGGLIGGALLG